MPEDNSIKDMSFTDDAFFELEETIHNEAMNIKNKEKKEETDNHADS